MATQKAAEVRCSSPRFSWAHYTPTTSHFRGSITSIVVLPTPSMLISASNFAPSTPCQCWRCSAFGSVSRFRIQHWGGGKGRGKQIWTSKTSAAICMKMGGIKNLDPRLRQVKLSDFELHLLFENLQHSIRKWRYTICTPVFHAEM